MSMMIRRDKDTDPTGLCSDMKNGCGPAAAESQRILNTPEGQRAQVVTIAAGAPIVIGGGVAAATTSAFVATVALSSAAGGTISALSSAAKGNSNGQILTDTGKGNGCTSAIIKLPLASRVEELQDQSAGLRAKAGAERMQDRCEIGGTNEEATMSAIAAGGQ